MGMSQSVKELSRNNLKIARMIFLGKRRPKIGTKKPHGLPAEPLSLYHQACVSYAPIPFVPIVPAQTQPFCGSVQPSLPFWALMGIPAYDCRGKSVSILYEAASDIFIASIAADIAFVAV